MRDDQVESISVRPATLADADAVARLFSRHLADLSLEPDPQLDGDMARFETFYAPPQGLLLLAGVAEGNVVGMAGLHRDEIRRVFVEKSWRRRGVATQLLKHLIEQAPPPSAGRFRAVLARENLPTQRLFLSLGFRPGRAAADDPGPTRCQVYELDRF
ncbi:MAG: GNAT family N-acetyltransferase [Verrucomicrobia bacterium]|jgi:GNAT superfamily N-acetyltransferase|nr:GNAT family N-acetyltransferase [Verrucomicrobiota bacterium]